MLCVCIRVHVHMERAHFGSSVTLQFLHFFGGWSVTLPFKQIFLHLICWISITKIVVIGQKNIVPLSSFLYWLALWQYCISLSASWVTDCLMKIYHVALHGGHKDVSWGKYPWCHSFSLQWTYNTKDKSYKPVISLCKFPHSCWWLAL